ncbi:MAG: TonB-dependent receptor [Pseudomonadales bacterium]|jgi:iron complex outermembrane receptor protein|nr:TonB-dependent receptor [Pseudomonadales bacterium]
MFNMFQRRSLWQAIQHSTVGLIYGVGLLGVVNAVHAAEAGPYIDPENPDFGRKVEELIVTASRDSGQLQPATASLAATQPQSIIDRKAIDQFIAQSADFTQIVNLSPSMSGTSYNGPGLSEAKSTLRGFKDGEYNITYDGIPWGDANGPSHHSTSFFPASTIGAVVVDRGPGAADQLGVATFGGSVNLFSPEVSEVGGGSQQFTLGSWNTLMSVTKLSTGSISQLNGARALFNIQALKTDGYLTHSDSTAYNQFVRVVVPIVDSWQLTLLGTWNQSKVQISDSSGATREQVEKYGKNFALTDDPKNPTYWRYNIVEKHTYFNYARLSGDLTPKTHLENTVYSYYYKNDTESALDPTVPDADIASCKGLQITQTPGGSPVVNCHVPGYTKLNVYTIYGNILHLDQELPFGTLKTGLWLERADTGPRARYDYDATASLFGGLRVPDYRQKALPGVPQYLEYEQYSGWNQYEPFVSLDWRVTPALTVSPGIKYVHENLHVEAEVNQRSREPFFDSHTFTKTLYFLTANYRIQDNLSAYAQYATGFLVPDVSVTQQSNPVLSGLQPQESTNYQLGVVYHGSRVSFDGDIYYIDFTNKLQTVSVTDPVTKQQDTVNFNLGGAVYKGVEGQVTFQATDNIFLFANGSFNPATAQGGETTIYGTPVTITGGKQIAGAPRSTAGFGAYWQDAALTVSLVDKYTGQYWSAEGEPEASKINGYHATDLSATYRWDRWRLQASIYNLFDSQRLTSIKVGKTAPADILYFQAERNFQLSLRMNF